MIMVPFCRRVREAERVLQAMAQHGIERGRNGLETYVMCEIPFNVIQLDAFASVFDGFSIGSSDLTQLSLGVARVLAIAGAKRIGPHIGICGEAPANYPDIPQYLVGLGIDCISVNPSSLACTITVVHPEPMRLLLRNAL